MMKENLIPLVVVVEHATIDATNRCQALPARGKGTKTILSFKVSLHAICKGTKALSSFKKPLHLCDAGERLEWTVCCQVSICVPERAPLAGQEYLSE